MKCDVGNCISNRKVATGCLIYHICTHDDSTTTLKFTGEFAESGIPLLGCQYYFKRMEDRWRNHVIDELAKGEVRTLVFKD